MIFWAFWNWHFSEEHWSLLHDSFVEGCNAFYGFISVFIYWFERFEDLNLWKKRTLAWCESACLAEYRKIRCVLTSLNRLGHSKDVVNVIFVGSEKVTSGISWLKLQIYEIRNSHWSGCTSAFLNANFTKTKNNISERLLDWILKTHRNIGAREMKQ